MNSEVSVVMSVYNEPIEWISQSIESILNQSFTNFEFIIINDKPDGKEQIALINEYASQDQRIKIIQNEKNLGLTKSLNIGILHAKSKYIARMDADDISMPNRLKMQYEFMESHPEIDICGTWAKLFGDIPLLAHKINKLPIRPEQIKLYALFYNPMIHPSMMLRLDSFTLPLYNETYKKAQDYVLVGESLIADKKLANIPQILIKYRVTKKSGLKDYVDQQSYSANHIRREMLLIAHHSLSDYEIKLHNDVMTLQQCNLKLAEQWLINLKFLLSKNHENQGEFIDNLFEFIWANICLSNFKTYTYYINSSLYNKFSFLYFIRFMKKAFIKLLR